MSESPSQTKLLYVDDDALSREVMHVLASKVIGADITLLDDNTNFMDKVRDLPAVPDVIFLDIQMRPHDGYEMLKMLRGDSMYKEATVIAMTASVMATDVQALRAAGLPAQRHHVRGCEFAAQPGLGSYACAQASPGMARAREGRYRSSNRGSQRNDGV